MKTLTILCTGLLLLSLLCLSGIAAAQADTQGTVVTADIEPYNGPIGADSPLYGLKLALENLDETFTVNETERVEKQMNHARLRLSEVRRSLDLNQSDSAEQALNNYWLKMDLANATISRWSSNTTGLLHAEEMIIKHQLVLENLLASNPNNTGLQRAYSNSLALEEKFAEKTEVKFQRIIEKNNRTILKAIRLEQKEHDRKGWPDVTVTTTTLSHGPPHTQVDCQAQGQCNQQDNTGNGKPVTTETTAISHGPPHTQVDCQGQGQCDQQGSDNDDKGKGNSKNK